MILFVFDSFLGFVHLQSGEEAKRSGAEPTPVAPAVEDRRFED